MSTNTDGYVPETSLMDLMDQTYASDRSDSSIYLDDTFCDSRTSTCRSRSSSREGTCRSIESLRTSRSRSSTDTCQEVVDTSRSESSLGTCRSNRSSVATCRPAIAKASRSRSLENAHVCHSSGCVHTCKVKSGRTSSVKSDRSRASSAATCLSFTDTTSAKTCRSTNDLTCAELDEMTCKSMEDVATCNSVDDLATCYSLEGITTAVEDHDMTDILGTALEATESMESLAAQTAPPIISASLESVYTAPPLSPSPSTSSVRTAPLLQSCSLESLMTADGNNLDEASEDLASAIAQSPSLYCMDDNSDAGTFSILFIIALSL